MRNPTLHSLLQQFTTDVGELLTRSAEQGEQVPFEVIEADASAKGRVPFYCYRPLTGDFISARLDLLKTPTSYAPAASGIESAGGAGSYLRALGEPVIPEDPRRRADAALRSFVARVFDERSDFGFDPERFASAYDELERKLYQDRCVTEVISPLRGLDLDPGTRELPLGEGLSLVRPAALVAAPPELSAEPAGSGDGTEAPGTSPLLIVLRTAHEWPQQPPVSTARWRFRRVLSALRLFEPGGYSIGPKGYARVDGGAWTAVAIGQAGRPRLITRVLRDQEDELRAFAGLVGRRLPVSRTAGRSARDQPLPDASGAGELAWALSRFEMGCERLAPFEALTDYLLAARALLEPEGPGSGRLAQRLSVICAPPGGQALLAERTAHAISLERAVIGSRRLRPASTR